MKVVFRILLLVILVFAGLFITYRFAGERVEVVELFTTDEAGETVTTRLWIVDHENLPYLRASGESSGWYTRLHANGEFDLNRDGQTRSYTAVDRRDIASTINARMQEKYTWGDSFVGFFMGSRDGSIPVELHVN